MKIQNVRAFALAAVVGLTASHAAAYSLLGTKWDVGGDNADFNAGNLGTPGGVTWSIMGVGLSMTAEFDNHVGNLTTDFGLLIGGNTLAEEINAINNAMNTWAAVSGFVNLGMVADGGGNAGASDANGGNTGTVRFGAGLGFGGELAHAWAPGTDDLQGDDWNKGGDVHVNTFYTWVDDPNDGAGGGFDLETVLLHEIGHSLGLGHSAPGTVMGPNYGGARRSLTADDIAGIQELYGPVPEPATFAAVGLGVASMLRRRKKSA